MSDAQRETSGSGVRSRSVVLSIPVSPGSPNEEDIFSDKAPSTPSTMTSSSSWWSWTFAIVYAPFILFGCPFYLLTTAPPPYYGQIRSTKVWIKRMFDFTSSTLSVIVTIILLVFTVILNIYVIFLLWNLFDNLFIRGRYETSMLQEMLAIVRDLPVVVGVDYIWLFGFKINNIITVLNHKHRKYKKYVSTTPFRIRVVFLLLITACLHIIRTVSFKKYTKFYEETTALKIIDKVWELSVGIYLSLMLPLYCLFCYAVTFELFVIKSVIYDMLSKRVPPTVAHLSKFKTLYTHAADHVDIINQIFALYMSWTIGLILVGTATDTEEALETGLKVLFQGVAGSFFGGPGPGPLQGILNSLLGKDNQPKTTQVPLDPLDALTTPSFAPPTLGNGNGTSITLSPETVRQLNAEIVYLISVCGMIFYTVWQAVATNDYLRELHVWLNDFVTGAGGTDIKEKLLEVGSQTVKRNDGSFDHTTVVKNDAFEFENVDINEGPKFPLVWAASGLKESGESDQLLDKYKMLKAYIHARMQLEKPAMLNIPLLGIVVPSLRGRLRDYKVIF